MGGLAAIHPGRVLQCFDHFVVDLRGDGRAATYFTVYAVEYSPELGTGHVAFLRARGDRVADDLDLTLTDAPEMAVRMQARLRAMTATLDMSRGIGTSLEQTPLLASFRRLPWTDAGVGWRIEAAAGGPTIEADWTAGEPPIWTAAMAGTFTPERDILGMLAGFDRVRVAVDGQVLPGRPYHDPWWESRVGRPFSSCHVALAEASLTPAGPWWSELRDAACEPSDPVPATREGPRP